ncbi:N-acyl-D-glucosamine 2-epimerase [Paenibacillus alkalitolerans]|uniref:N-acyl-D-glucosamine 2-epimerase n=1 Tax=Paenibacillus alkalitolerans TaxID=2799335 RepID=UPI0018F7BA26|nr:N-acyl-D-glucosamine 2-epimerase [Paenibacillus alkalitolerans]
MGTTSGAKGTAVFGPSIQVDPLFPYYRNRSCESIADEIANAGYNIVHYFVVNENIVNRELIEAFRRKGVAVWAMVLGNGTFSTEHYPPDWPEWRMELLKETNDGFTRLSYFCDRYVEWKKASVARLLREYPFDGIEIAEPYFPEWGGIERGIYGDVGPRARQKFKDAFGLDIPEFRDRKSPNYYRKNADTYNKWIQFRVNAVNDFINEMINGKGGARAVRPDIAVATWSLAVDAGPDSVRLLREYQGLDAPSMISKVRPDIHCLQTHWPDWIKRRLPPDYIVKYRPFTDGIRAVHPRLPLAVQADIGSARKMIRSGAWLRGFKQTAERLGYASWTAYEYHIGGYMYEQAPFPKRAVRVDSKRLAVSFNKRIDERTAAQAQNYSFPDSAVTVRGIIADGNRVIIETEGLPAHAFEIECRNILDTPSLWLYKDFPPNAVPSGFRVTVPEM